ncbi:MAG: hypothetical protein CME06_07590 [Gemmatimonadetes bacterium]|nr:hypothetical protein [Gemmatimonadota bacterium]
MPTPNNGSRKSRLLVVEDDRVLRMTILEYMEDQRFDSEGVESAEAALRWLETGDCDVVLADIHLPNATGIELLKLLRERHPEIEVVLMTGHATLETAIQAVNLGAFCYIQKPFDATELFMTLERAMEVRQLRLDREELIARQQATLDRLRSTLRRLVETRDQMIAASRKRAIDDTLVTLQHELNNRGMGITAAAGCARRDVEKGKHEAVLGALASIEDLAIDISAMLERVSSLSAPESTEYVEGTTMIDLKSEEKSKEEG